MGANLTRSPRRLRDAGAADAPAPGYGPLRVCFDEALAPRADTAEVAWYVTRLPREAGVVLAGDRRTWPPA